MNDDSVIITDEGSTEQQPGRTQWHRLLGAMLEMLLTPVGITVQTEVQVISDPPKADVVLLRRKGVRWTPSQLRLLCDGLCDNQASQQLLEFKYRESFNGVCLQQAVGYDYFYRQSQHVNAEAIQTSVISARTPRAAVLRQYGYVETETPGVYRSSYPLLNQVQVIVLNQLRPVEQNAFVQCFASRMNKQPFWCADHSLPIPIMRTVVAQHDPVCYTLQKNHGPLLTNDVAYGILCVVLHTCA